jgi:hypothetical protein
MARDDVDVAVDFVEQLREGPAVLYLGQGYLALETGVDPLLEATRRKYELPAGARLGYAGLLTSAFGDEAPSSYSWLNERSREIPPPAWLRTVASYAWSAMVTSAVDSVWVDALREPWREVVPVYEEAHRPAEPRDRTNLHCTLLFGCVRWPEVAPLPRDEFDRRGRAQAAVAMLRRLPDILTPRGLLVIDGYSADDWLSPDELSPVLAQLGPAQVHLFSARETTRTHPDVITLVERGIVVLHDDSVATELLRAAEQGRLRLGEPPFLRDGGHPLRLREVDVTVPRDLWHRVSRHATVLDDSALERPKPLTDTARYHAFRDFIARSEGIPNWEGFRRGFAFERGVERTLAEAVRAELESPRLQDQPIILHGPTGTGKTMALARLALRVRESSNAAVLYLARSSLPPVANDLDSFCEWAEDAAGARTLVVWDGMTNSDDYYDLVRFFNSRGRKAVVVGSTYRLEGVRNRHLVEAPPRLSEDEAKRFGAFLTTIDPELARRLPAANVLQSDAFLVSLYRLLPPSRAQLRSGVVFEVGAAESRIAKREAEHDTEIAPVTAMQRALLDAGLLSDVEPLGQSVATVSGETVTGLQRLTGLVMVPGQFGLKVPLELLMRALGRPGYQNFVELLQDSDVFQWYEDELGNIELGPRNALEAELVVQARLGSALTEVAFVRRLVEELSGGLSEGPNRDINFAANLVQALDAQPRRARYQSYFRDVAQSLRYSRTERGCTSPQLMLQEAHLLREWAVAAQQRGSAGDDDIASALEVAVAVGRDALDLAEGDRRSALLRGNLLVELASALAGSALQLARRDEMTKACEFYWMSRDTSSEARAAIPDSYHPLDVLGWSTLDLIEAGALSEVDKAEALAALVSAFQTADASLYGPTSQELFLRRQVKVGDLFDRFDLSEPAFEQLRERGSAAGFVLRALRLAGARHSRDWRKADAAAALEYLELHDDEIGNDGRALELRIDLWWVAHVGEPMFSKERVALPFSPSDWAAMLTLLRRIRGGGASFRPVAIAFLAGLAEFHLENFSEAFRTFREVERDSEEVRSRWRIIRSFVASLPTGQPRQFHGVVADVFAAGLRGEAFVEEIQRRVPLLASDFGFHEISRDQALGTFNIAFSFRGPIVEPASAFVATRDRERQQSDGDHRGSLR